MPLTPWTEQELTKLINAYGRVKPSSLVVSFPGRSAGAVKDRILHLQKAGVLPEQNIWTLEEILFLCDTYRYYSVEEFHMMLPHPKWAIQSRIGILTIGSQEQTVLPWSTAEESFLIHNLTSLSIKELSTYLHRSDADVKSRINTFFSMGLVNFDSSKLKDFFYSDTPKLKELNCSVCDSPMRIRFNEKRYPAKIYCSLKCKFTLPTTKKSLMYLVLEEKKNLRDIAKIFSMTQEKVEALIDKYFDGKVAKTIEAPAVQQPRTVRVGKRDDLNDLYLRSSWEANIGRILNKEKKIWEYEPKTFMFKNIQRGSVSYTPDFYVKNYEGRNKHIWIEVKGRMNSGDYTKLLNFKRQYPNEFKKLRGVVGRNSKAEKSFKKLGIPILWYYGDLRKKYYKTLPNWEGN